MGERMRLGQARAFRYRGDVAYEAKLASPDLLTGLRTDAFATEYKCDLTASTPPPCGHQVVIQRMPDGKVGVVWGNHHVGHVDSEDMGSVGAVIDAIGGAVTASVERHATIGTCFTVRVNAPRKLRDA